MRRRVYFDNAATTFPKPEGVADAVYNYIRNVGSNINRGGYSSAYEAQDIVMETRGRLKALFNAPDERNVIFTSGATMSLNMILGGLLKQGDHVLTSSMEHNAVMRPLTLLDERGIITFDRVMCGADGSIDIGEVESAVRDNTKVIVMTHASNVNGVILPVRNIGRLCRERGIYFVVDAAQTAGVIDIDMEDMCIDALCFAGHKGLMGPQGIGGFVLGRRLDGSDGPGHGAVLKAAAALPDTLIAGGTGSMSHLETMPTFLPDRFESGTLNIPGIYGLNEGLKFIEKVGMKTIGAHENELAGMFEKELEGITGVRVVGRNKVTGNAVTAEHTGVTSVVFDNIDCAKAAYILDDEFGIQTRVGLHCAPSAHRTIGTFPGGTVRFSFGYFNTREEVAYGAEAVRSICERCGA